MRAFLTALMLLAAAPAAAAELVMVEEKWCEWCERWDAEIGVIYDRTEEGRRAPLRRISIHDTLPADLRLKSRPRYTPTFILVEDGVEIGRIEGYPGEDFFWGLLGQLLERLDRRAPGKSAALENVGHFGTLSLGPAPQARRPG